MKNSLDKQACTRYERENERERERETAQGKMPGFLPFPLPLGLCVWILATCPTTMGFNPNFGHSVTHSDITKMASLRIVLRMFQEIPNPKGKVLPKEAFQLEDQELTAEDIFETYYESKVSVRQFKKALSIITKKNTLVDVKYALAAERHFDSETLRKGKEVLLMEKARVVHNILQGNYHQAQKHMGTMLHTLQDFYSHSNWVELGFQIPNSKLIKAGEPIGRIAGKNEETCTECSRKNQCADEILDSVLKEKIITTGYFSFKPHSRPTGKCSHGGKADLSKRGNQGINKDSLNSPHGQYHREAARLATLATQELFQDVWDTVGHQHFLRFFNIKSSAGLSFVMDTTGSMRDDIEAAKERTMRIVDNRRRSNTQPSFYILVPFNDPDFGPVSKTIDPDKFIKWLELLEADGGGDIPEMSLSALQLALTNTPPLSDIYVFTDAPAKDSQLKGTILALIEQTKCKVSFLLTNAVSRRKRYLGDQLGNELYRELAQASGGLAVVIQRQFIAQLTSIIEGMTTTALVTVLQRQNNLEYPSNSFTFSADSTLENITVYISGRPGSFYITSPTGLRQMGSISSGDLASVDHLGDLIVIRLHSPLAPGEWDLVVTSGLPYSVKVTGQSVVDFIYNFIEPIEGAHPGFAVLSGRPMAGMESTMEITVTGLPQYPSLRLHNLTLLNTQGVTLKQQPLKATSSPDTFLVEFQTLPEVGFYVQLRGEGENGARFQRQSPTISWTTKTRVKVSADPSVKAGSTANVSFSVTNTGKSAYYQIAITDDQNFIQFQPESVFINTNQLTERKTVISVPKDTEPGTVVTLTVQATSDTELGYNILELTVTSQEDNLSPPACDIISRSTECTEGPPEQCGLQNWTLAVQFLSNSTRSLSIFVRRGKGTLTRREIQDGGERLTLVEYSSDCCFPGVELVAVDRLGNVGKCSSRILNKAPGSAISNVAALLVAAILATLLC